MFRYQLHTRAKKYLKKIRKKDKKLYTKIDKAISDIRTDPYAAGDPKKGDLASVYGYDVYHNGTNYEIAYTIDVDEQGDIVLFILAGTRENFYDELKRYWT